MPCAVEGCDSIGDIRRGYCLKHYLRLRRHGSPTAGGPVYGEPAKFLNKALASTQEECIFWPFYRDPNGYARMRRDGKTVVLHRVICEMVNGPPPGSEFQSTHKCGKGADGCINPRHLEWGTAFKNQQDRVEHGTSNRGERCASHKLTAEQAAEIFDALMAGVPNTVLAAEYGVHRRTINDIRLGRSWAWLTGLPNPRARDKYGNLIAANDNHHEGE